MAEKQQQNRPANSSQSGNIGSQGSTQAPPRQKENRDDDASSREPRQGQRGDSQREGKFSPQDEDNELVGREDDLEEIEERDEDDDEEQA